MQWLIQSTCRLRFTYWTLKGTDNDPSKEGSFFVYIIQQYTSEQKENTKKRKCVSVIITILTKENHFDIHTLQKHGKNNKNVPLWRFPKRDDK